MARIKEGRTSISIARAATTSLRTTIPAHITKQLKLAAKDQLDWSLDKDDEGWVAKIRKAPTEE